MYLPKAECQMHLLFFMRQRSLPTSGCTFRRPNARCTFCFSCGSARFPQADVPSEGRMPDAPFVFHAAALASHKRMYLPKAECQMHLLFFMRQRSLPTSGKPDAVSTIRIPTSGHFNIPSHGMAYELATDQLAH